MNTKSVTKTEGLPPCPFCGSEDYYITLTDNPFSYDTYSTAHCSKCHATGPFVAESYLEDEPKPTRDYMEAVAKEKWQTRPIEDDLRKRIAELEEAQRWIPVSDRLPEDGVAVLVAFTENPKDIDILTAKYYKHYAGFGGLDNWWNIEGWHTGNVTHWMPLPEPPEVTE